jgi:hypothetical protein
MSSFAENQLLKYGWEKGQGLGKKKGSFVLILMELIKLLECQ